jgi:hypothetical protein
LTEREDSCRHRILKHNRELAAIVRQRVVSKIDPIEHDLRNIYRPDEMIAHGFVYHSVGRLSPTKEHPSSGHSALSPASSAWRPRISPGPSLCVPSMIDSLEVEVLYPA